MKRVSAEAVKAALERAADVAKVTAARPSPSDIRDAFKGLPPTVVQNPDGTERIDYQEIPLKNSDGSPTKYAGRLVELHAKHIAAGQEFNAKINAGAQHETLLLPSGERRNVPAEHARLAAGRLKARPAPAPLKWTTRTVVRDGALIEMRREPGGRITFRKVG